MRSLGWAGLVQGGPAEHALPVVCSARVVHTASHSEHLLPSLFVRESPTRPAAAALQGVTLAIEIFGH